jgi:K+-sensing histidine kinase KdpD
MNKLSVTRLMPLMKSAFSAVLVVTGTSFALLLVNRDVVGHGVIALLLLVAVMLSAYQWGLAAGMSAAISAALAFDFLFIPPYFSFSIGNLEGWLIFVIFFAVAIIFVERIQSTLSKAQASEREAVMMYELSALLSNLRTQDAISRYVARFLFQHYMAALVIVSIQPKGQPNLVTAQEPMAGQINTNPDRILPILNSWGLVGEIQIWQSADFDLPANESRIFHNIALQVGVAIERVQIKEFEYKIGSSPELSNPQ